MEESESRLAIGFQRLYELRDRNNKLFVAAWKRLAELDPEFWRRHQREISITDREITDVMDKLCK